MPALVARSPSFGPKWSFDDLEIELLSVPTNSNTHENTDASRVEPTRGAMYGAWTEMARYEIRGSDHGQIGLVSAD